jgi:hypothetical protein
MDRRNINRALRSRSERFRMPGLSPAVAEWDKRAMTRRALLVCALLLVAATPLAAHHGWGSYDAAKPVTVTGKVLTSKFENPHVTLTLQATDKVWTVTLAPTSRMLTRGALQELVAVGRTITAFGYSSTVEKDEMRAERITVDGKTYEMR